VTALACGHTMCRPGSDDCNRRTEVAAELARGSERAALGKLAEQLGGRPLYVGHPSLSAAQSAARHHPLPAALVAQLIDDALQQLDQVAGTTALIYGPHVINRAEMISRAVQNWHDNNPGLSRLLDLTRPETTEGS
jgi:hypothetical protein